MDAKIRSNSRIFKMYTANEKIGLPSMQKADCCYEICSIFIKNPTNCSTGDCGTMDIFRRTIVLSMK